MTCISPISNLLARAWMISRRTGITPAGFAEGVRTLPLVVQRMLNCSN
jgi:hypothetical protein